MCECSILFYCSALENWSLPNVFTLYSCCFLRLQGGCQNDYIEIYDGPPNTSPLLRRICSGYNVAYTSSSNLMTIRFHSDSRYSSSGFYAEYRSFPADQSTSKFPSLNNVFFAKRLLYPDFICQISICWHCWAAPTKMIFLLEFHN